MLRAYWLQQERRTTYCGSALTMGNGLISFPKLYHTETGFADWLCGPVFRYWIWIQVSPSKSSSHSVIDKTKPRRAKLYCAWPNGIDQKSPRFKNVYLPARNYQTHVLRIRGYSGPHLDGDNGYRKIAAIRQRIIFFYTTGQSNSWKALAKTTWYQTGIFCTKWLWLAIDALYAFAKSMAFKTRRTWALRGFMAFNISEKSWFTS